MRTASSPAECAPPGSSLVLVHREDPLSLPTTHEVIDEVVAGVVAATARV
jgi:hypothetical protein